MKTTTATVQQEPQTTVNINDILVEYTEIIVH